MIDRFGKQICVAWSEHEILWVEAANSLMAEDRTAALHDIASMTGRSFHAIQERACRIYRVALQARDAAKRAARAEEDMQIVLVPRAPLAPFRQPTKQQLMAGRARP